MKKSRHQKIIDLVQHTRIATQEELADILNQEGYKVTQATVSRDIKELKLSKVPGPGGVQYYQLLEPEEQEAVEIMRKAINGMRTDEAVENILNMFARTRNNQEYIHMVKKNRIV